MPCGNYDYGKNIVFDEINDAVIPLSYSITWTVGYLLVPSAHPQKKPILFS